MNHELQKLFNPILDKEKKKGINLAFDRIIWTIHNTDEKDLKDLFNKMNKEDYIKMFKNLQKELIKKEFKPLTNN